MSKKRPTHLQLVPEFILNVWLKSRGNRLRTKLLLDAMRASNNPLCRGVTDSGVCNALLKLSTGFVGNYEPPLKATRVRGVRGYVYEINEASMKRWLLEYPNRKGRPYAKRRSNQSSEPVPSVGRKSLDRELSAAMLSMMAAWRALDAVVNDILCSVEGTRFNAVEGDLRTVLKQQVSLLKCAGAAVYNTSTLVKGLAAELDLTKKEEKDHE